MSSNFAIILDRDMSDGTSACLDRLRQAGLGVEQAIDDAHSGKRASVLVGLFQGEDNETHVLLTKRSENLRSHPGQVCFPGGKMEDADHGSDVACAMRETKEEVGLKGDHIEPVCKLSSSMSVNGLTVTPVVARITKVPFDVNELDLCPQEVESAFIAPLSLFIKEHRADEVVWHGDLFVMRTYYQSYRGKEFEISGLTAHICHEVAQIAFGGTGKRRLIL